MNQCTVVASSFAPLILVSPPLFVLPYLPYKNEGFQNIAFFSALHNLFVGRVNEECNKTVGANLVSGYLIRVKYRYLCFHLAEIIRNLQVLSQQFSRFALPQ